MPNKPYVHRTVFPNEFRKALASRESDQAMLLRGMEKRGYRITKQFLNLMAVGKRRVPGQQLSRIIETLGLNQDESRRLHHAAALDAGYDLGKFKGG